MSHCPTRHALPLLVALGACGHAAKRPPPPGQPVSFDTVCAQPSGTAVRITGYFRYPRSMSGFFCIGHGDDQQCEMRLYETGGEPPSNSVADVLAAAPPAEIRNLTIDVPVGGAPGEMARLPKRFSTDDVALHLAHGRATEGAHVTLDGIVQSTPGQTAVGANLACRVVVAWAAP